jgi:hypothetical protein
MTRSGRDNIEPLTTAEARVLRLLGSGWRVEASRSSGRTTHLLAPGVLNCWSGENIVVRRSTLTNLKRKRPNDVA